MATTKSSKGSRIGTVLQQLEESWKEYCSNIKQNIAQQHDTVRSVVAKLHQLLSTQDRCCKIFLSSHRESGVSLLFDILQYFSKVDYVICTTILDSFLSLCTTAKRISTLIDCGILCVLTDCLVRLTNAFINSKEPYQLEELFLSLHTLLAKLGSKDKRLVTLARLSGAVSSSVMVLKTYDTNIRILHPVLQVIKIYSNSAANSNILVKGGVIATLMKLLPVCGQKKLQLLRLCLELLSVLCKSKTGAKKAVSLSVIPTLLTLYQEWHRTDHRNRHLYIRKSILLVIKACTIFGFGKKSFSNSDGFRILYFLGLEGIERKECDSLLRVLTFVLRKCVKNNKVSVRSQQSVYSYLLPSNQSGSSTEKTTTLDDSDDNLPSINEDVDSVDTDDDDVVASSDDDDDMVEDDVEEVDTSSLNINLPDDSMSDLKLETYKQFLQELNMYDKETPGEETEPTIRIPTASLESSTNSNGTTEHIFLTEFEDSENSLNNPNSELFERIRQINIMEFSSSTDITNQQCADTLNKENQPEIPCDIVSMHTSFTMTSTSTAETTGELSVDEKVLNIVQPENVDSTISPTSASFCENENSPVSLDTIQEHSQISPKRFHENLQISPTNTFQEHEKSSEPNRTASLPSCVSNSLVDHEYPQLSPLPAGRKDDEYGVEHVLDFVKKAEPVTYGHLSPVDPEPLLEKKTNLQRLMLFQDLARHVFPDRVAHRVVYDLDELVQKTPPLTPMVSLTNVQSSTRISTPIRKSQSAPKILATSRRGSSVSPLKDEILKIQPLLFESRFECGNLRKAIQIRHYEYDLVLNSDTNSSSHHQWFYFQIENMEVDVEYRFNIINCEKANSQFNYGMQPVVYSVHEAKNGNPGWERMGTNVCYYRNYFTRGPNSVKTYFTATFTLSFAHKNDRCFVAYHYPYTLSMLKMDLLRMEASLSLLMYKRQILCETLGGNDVHLVTITNPSPHARQSDIDKRPYVVLMARVHPGESNSSWIMKAIMNFLVSTDMVARQLRSIFIFKIIPILNPDGVVNGNHRCSLTGQDLNRQWKNPDSVLHPSIYKVKSLIQTMNMLNKKPFVFVDFHGHSRKKNVFMYGCQPQQQQKQHQCNPSGHAEQNAGLTCDEEIEKVKQFPSILSGVSPYFSLQSSSYVMEKSKEATARIVGYKELGIERCYTLESTYCGMDQGEFAGYHMGTRELEDMGRTFCKALLKLAMCPDVDIYD